MRVMISSPRLLIALFAIYFATAGVPPAHAEKPGNPIAAMVSAVQAAIVRVVTVRRPKQGGETPVTDDEIASSEERPSTAIGSGFFVDRFGYIATNKHVIEDALSVFVVTANGVRYKATIVGMTAKADIALIKISAPHDFPFVRLADSDRARVGDAAIAIGSPFGFDGSVTAGIISAVNRNIMESPFDDYIQTDAMTNHGNSGGPLFNLAGEVIGMNSVLFAPGKYSGSAGVGFAIPSNDIRLVIAHLKAHGEVRAGMLPIRTQQVTWMIAQAIGAPGMGGALVAGLEPGGVEMVHGRLKPGDVILSFNGQPVADPRDLARRAARAQIGSEAALEIFHNGVREIVHVMVHAWPEERPPAANEGAVHPLGLQLAFRPQGGAPRVTVTFVDPVGTAADSGLQEGDIIVQVQQESVSDPDDAMRILLAQSHQKRHFALVLVERNKKQTWIPISVPD